MKSNASIKEIEKNFKNMNYVERVEVANSIVRSKLLGYLYDMEKEYCLSNLSTVELLRKVLEYSEDLAKEYVNLMLNLIEVIQETEIEVTRKATDRMVIDRKYSYCEIGRFPLFTYDKNGNLTKIVLSPKCSNTVFAESLLRVLETRLVSIKEEQVRVLKK